MLCLKWASRVVIIGGICVTLGGCGLFETRTPEQPPPPVEGCRPLTGATPVFLNIEDFYGRSAGTTCYSNMVEKSFAFHPDPQDSSQFLPQTPFDAWNDSVEVKVNGQIVSAQQFIQVDFTTEYATPIISNDQKTETHFWDYELRFQYRPSSPDPQPQVLRFTGKADLTLQQGTNGDWKITSWVDHRGGITDSTWGFLRASNRP